MGIINSAVGFAKDSVKEIGYVIVLSTAPVAFLTGLAPTPEPAVEAPKAALQVVVPVGGHVEVGERQCEDGGFYTDTQVYRSSGLPLAAKETNSDRTVDYWRGQGGRVTWDGITFRNQTRGQVTVTAWCHE